MYLSLNFRWPMLLGQNGTTPTSAANSTSVANSAFKTVPSSSCPNTMALPPISCLKEGPMSLLPPLGNPQTAQPHHHHGRGVCQNYLHHPEPQFPGLSGLKDIPGISGVSGGLPGTPGMVHGPQSSTNAHPAFPMTVPPWLQHPQAYNLAHLQHLLGQDKAVALSQYLNDPLAKAALMDLGRVGVGQFGQYPLGKKLFGCPQCRYITDRKNNLKRHIATMHQECDKVLECCGIAFKNKASLRDHVLIFHSNGYMCRYCGRNFCRKALLKRHLTVHSGQKDYICSMCDYATSHKSNLERHKKVHERQGQEGGDLDQEHPDLCLRPESDPETDEEDIEVTEDGDSEFASPFASCTATLASSRLHLSHNINGLLSNPRTGQPSFEAGLEAETSKTEMTLSRASSNDDIDVEDHSSGLINVVDIGD